MTLAIQPLTFKPPKLRDVSRKHLDTVYEQHYGGLLREHNQLDAGQTDAQAQTAAEVALFENYLAALTDEDVGAPSTKLAAALDQGTGGAAGWQASLKELAKANASGWVIAARADGEDTLVNQWTASRTAAPTKSRIVFALPIDRSIVAIDFADDTDAYVDAVLGNVNWSVLNARFDGTELPASDVPACSVESLVDAMAAGDSVRLLDVRQPDDLDGEKVKGSEWYDPAKVDDWAASLKDESDVVVYCVYGGWVSAGAAEALRERGIKARLLAGGISSWRALDLDRVPFQAPESS